MVCYLKLITFLLCLTLSMGSLIEFNNMLKDVLKRNPAILVGYGRYCGAGSLPGKPIDKIDSCCKVHDDCYGTWENLYKKNPLVTVYHWSLRNGVVSCGLQSPNLGLQCESIAEYPNIVKKYPFPVVISPIFVQIIEAFHRGPNYLRLIVIKSCNTCLEHIGKLTCAEDIINNLSLVMVSNDPCARALCLKLLGILHPIFNANKSVHHMIMLCLDSHYDIELNAAIEACNAYAPISKEFAGGLCEKLCVKLESLSTDLKLKIELIKLARYLHHDAETIRETRNCLISLLNRYRSLEFVINIVDTLTMLTTRAAIHSQNLIDLLIEQIQIEEREPAVLAILNNKLILARRMSHSWTEGHISFLCHLFNKSDPIKKKNLVANCKIIEILSVLAESSCPASIFIHEKSKNSILILIIECASAAALIESDFFDVVYRINYFGINLLTSIAIATRDMELAEHVLNTYYVNAGNVWQKPHCNSFKYIFQCNSTILKLLNEFPELYAPFLTKNISYLVEELTDGKHISNRGFSVFCRFMTNFCFNLPYEVNRLLPSSVGIIDLLHSNNCQRPCDQYLSICSFVFQLVNCEGGLLISDENSRKLIDWIVRYEPDNWALYRIGRMANRYNQHKIASEVYRIILPSVISPHYIYWIRGLIEISDAESILMSLNNNESNKLIDVILSAQKHFYQSKNSFKCSGSSLWWVDYYIKIRCQFLNAIYILVVTVNQYGLKSNSKTMKLSALNENKSLFKSNIDQITDLIDMSIDADDCTIKQLQWLKQLSSLFLQTLQNYNAYVDNSFDKKNSHQDYWVMRLCEEISINYKNSTEHQDDNQLITDKMKLLMTLATNSVKIGVPFSRFMFQKLQNTEVRLMAVLNGKSVANESNVDIPLRQDQSHKLQVFGIIQQHCKIGQPIRIVNRVQISISLMLNQPSKILENEKPLLVVDNIVKLHNDYFTCHVLLDLKKCSPVKYQLIMKASPIDSAGVKWETREVSSCIVKVESLTNGTVLKSQLIR